MALGFVKLSRSDQALKLLSSDPKAFHLLTWIAFRASRETGEALIGDWKVMGATSEAAYRRAKKRLEATGLATFKPTSKGTIAKLVGTQVYDINIIEADDQSDEQPDDQRVKKATIKATTNKKLKNLNIRNKENTLCLFDEFWQAFPKNRRGNKKPALAEWQKIPEELHRPIINHVKKRCACDPEWLKENFRFVQHAERFLKHERFYDEFEEKRDVRERIFNSRWSDRNPETRDANSRSNRGRSQFVVRDISLDLPQLDEGKVG